MLNRFQLKVAPGKKHSIFLTSSSRDIIKKTELATARTNHSSIPIKVSNVTEYKGEKKHQIESNRTVLYILIE